MKNVASVLKRKARAIVKTVQRDWPLPEQLMGIEVELDPARGNDRIKMPANYQPYWREERDGSLRNGREYVLTSPMAGNLLSTAIAQLFSDDPNMDRTATGSTHIHIDMLEDSTPVNTIPVLTMLMFILEPAVFAAADPGREWCGYTNRLSSAPDVLLGSVLNGDLETDATALVDVVAGHSAAAIGRYYGLNLQALQKYGSIEFRYFPTATTADELASWVRMVQLCKKAAMDLGSLQRVEAVVKDEESYKQFIVSYFKEWADTFLTTVPQYAALQSYYKARAVADSWRVREDVQFDPRAITSNKAFAKFLKKKIKVEEQTVQLPAYVIPPMYDVPRATLGAVLVAGRRVYVGVPIYSTRDSHIHWDNLEGHRTDLITKMTETMSRHMLETIYNNITNLPTESENQYTAPARGRTVALDMVSRALTILAQREQEGYYQTNQSRPPTLSGRYIDLAEAAQLVRNENEVYAAPLRTVRVDDLSAPANTGHSAGTAPYALQEETPSPANVWLDDAIPVDPPPVQEGDFE